MPDGLRFTESTQSHHPVEGTRRRLTPESRATVVPTMQPGEATERFLLELRHQAHRQLPADRAEQIVAETANHLEDSIAHRIIAGDTPGYAEKQALSGFGKPHWFLQALIDGMNNTYPSRLARTISFGIAGVTLLMMAYSLILTVLSVGNNWGFRAGVPPLPLPPEVVLSLGAIGVAIGGCISRRREPRRYLALGAITAALAGLFVGSTVVSVYGTTWSRNAFRPTLPLKIEALQMQLERARQENALIQKGIAFYNDPKSEEKISDLKQRRELAIKQLHMVRLASFDRNWDGSIRPMSVKELSAFRRRQDRLVKEISAISSEYAVAKLDYYQNLTSMPNSTPPGALMVGNEYLLVNGKTEWVGKAESAFRPAPRSPWERQARPLPWYGVALHAEKELQASPVLTTMDLKTAARRWREYGPIWLKGRQASIARLNNKLRSHQFAIDDPFNLQRATEMFGMMFIFGLILLVANLIGAFAGRQIRRGWDEWKWRLRSAG